MTKLKDIAARLGLSPATVSRALNGFPEVNEQTRQRVQAVARAMNYRPNQIAQKLVSGRSGMIGMILRSPVDVATDPSFFEVMAGLSSRLADYDMDLVFHASNAEDEVAPYRRLVAKATLDGFILNAPTVEDQRIQFLTAAGVPFVVHGRAGLGVPDYPFFDIDNAALARQSVALLHDLGHRRIAFLNGPANYAYAAQRLSGFQSALAARGLVTPTRFIRHDRLAEDYGQRAAATMLTDTAAPTAFLCASTLIAAGVLRAARKAGLSVPGDLSVIAHDDAIPQFRAVNFEPALTVTRAPIRDACGPLTDKMVRLLDGAQSSDLQTMVTADLIVRQSTGPVPVGQQGGWNETSVVAD
ncbi:substrate-binding domain-containing protein [Neogemmobacter tilapiae]|uniref:Transcriptional regulator n=1 Tax=Neogemmobacter tilapiae TaxID=875041 RepID=A0A918WLC5_9RHOB|nr:substrate-binding domain-containing protein [Gemmobacter tilapiae]GHC62079.1 transcriptional regulator [Gemmobacter tilapiae]